MPVAHRQPSVTRVCVCVCARLQYARRPVACLWDAPDVFYNIIRGRARADFGATANTHTHTYADDDDDVMGSRSVFLMKCSGRR